jgi:hypothetical protein
VSTPCGQWSKVFPSDVDVCKASDIHHVRRSLAHDLVGDLGTHFHVLALRTLHSRQQSDSGSLKPSFLDIQLCRRAPGAISRWGASAPLCRPRQNGDGRWDLPRRSFDL